jgi:tetratricopeptide (TPR) repeat protein
MVAKSGRKQFTSPSERRLSLFLLVLLAAAFAALLPGQVMQAAPSRPGDEARAADLLDQANKLFNRNQWFPCIALCNRIIAMAPNYGKAYQTRGMAYNKGEKYQQAIADLDKAIAFEGVKVNRDAWIGRGDSYLALDQPEKAMKDFNQAVKLHPDFAGGYLRRSELFCLNKQYEAAIRDANQMVKLEHDATWALQTRAMILYEAGRYKACIDDYTKIIKITPDFDRAYITRAKAYEKLGEKELAAKDRAKALEISRKSLY